MWPGLGDDDSAMLVPVKALFKHAAAKIIGLTFHHLLYGDDLAGASLT